MRPRNQPSATMTLIALRPCRMRAVTSWVAMTVRAWCAVHPGARCSSSVRRPLMRHSWTPCPEILSSARVTAAGASNSVRRCGAGPPVCEGIPTRRASSSEPSTPASILIGADHGPHPSRSRRRTEYSRTSLTPKAPPGARTPTPPGPSWASASTHPASPIRVRSWWDVASVVARQVSVTSSRGTPRSPAGNWLWSWLATGGIGGPFRRGGWRAGQRPVQGSSGRGRGRSPAPRRRPWMPERAR